MSAIPPGALVLVTGANSFIGTNIITHLLDSGYSVRGQVRDLDRCSWLTDFYSRYGPGRFSLMQVSDISADNAFSEAAKDCSGIIHTAGIHPFGATDPDDIIPLEVKTAYNVLAAAAKEPNMRRVVYTSSAWAAHMPRPGEGPYTVDMWTFDDAAVHSAYNPPEGQTVSGSYIHSANKATTERAMWSWVKENNPSFVLNTVVPDVVLGRIQKADKQSATTGGFLRMLFYGENVETVANFVFPQWFVDVGDTARLHIAGLVDEDVRGERLLGYAQPFTWNDVLGIFKKLWPERDFVKDIEGLEPDQGTINNKRPLEVLKRMGRRGWVSLEESVKDNVESFLHVNEKPTGGILG